MNTNYNPMPRCLLRSALTTVVFFAFSPVGHAAAPAFVDDFAGSGSIDGSKWQVSTWSNGKPFGCHFAANQVNRVSGLLQLGINVPNRECSEVRTWKKFKQGKFIVEFTPSTFAGGNSSFFLYTGVAGTNSHYELDVELIKGGSVLHTNVWKNGQQSQKDFPVAVGFKRIGIEWRPGLVRFFRANADGSETNIRKVAVSFPSYVEMPLLLNHWYSDGSYDGKIFLGALDTSLKTATAKYQSVRIEP